MKGIPKTCTTNSNPLLSLYATMHAIMLGDYMLC